MAASGNGGGGGGVGTGTIAMWLLGAIMTVAMMLATYNLSQMTTRVQTLEGTAASNRERISALEADYRNINASLTRIENKLDEHARGVP